MEQAIAEIIAELAARAPQGVSTREVRRIVTAAAKRHGLPRTPSLIELIRAIPEDKRGLLPMLVRRPVRSASGVAVVAVMCKPHRCPHAAATGAHCIYCPGGLDSDFAYSSQSYTGFEPTSMRAIRARYDARAQASTRLRQLQELGHACDKVELILMGGTFMSLAPDYRDRFIAGMLDGLSGHASLAPSEAVRFAERCSHRPVGLTIETRPDYCNPTHLRSMLWYGATRLEVGVQTIFPDVLKDVNRGHGVASIHRCMAQARDAGFKLTAHIMPNLPGTDPVRDSWLMRQLHEDPRLRPDGLKLYPTLVMRGTILYERWRKGQYRPYNPDELTAVLVRCMSLCPPWTRVYRVMRDIPLPLTSASAVTGGDVRTAVMRGLRESGALCLEVRQREVGLAPGVGEEGGEGEGCDIPAPDSLCVGEGEGKGKGKEKGEKEGVEREGEEGRDGREGEHGKRQGRVRRETREKGREKGRGRRERRREEPAALDDQGAGLADRLGKKDRAELTRRDYYAGGGWETFLSYEIPTGGAPLLVGLCRLRQMPWGRGGRARGLGREVAGPCSIIRELHVYGQAAGIGDDKRTQAAFQHRGFGRLLLEEAERIALDEHRSTHLAVISGIGVREYYERLGYTHSGPYMSKQLRHSHC